jgi:hypothetical protein
MGGRPVCSYLQRKLRLVKQGERSSYGGEVADEVDSGEHDERGLYIAAQPARAVVVLPIGRRHGPPGRRCDRRTFSGARPRINNAQSGNKGVKDGNLLSKQGQLAVAFAARALLRCHNRRRRSKGNQVCSLPRQLGHVSIIGTPCWRRCCRCHYR